MATTTERTEATEDDAPIPFTAEELAEASLYPLLIEWDPRDDMWIASCPDLPGAITHGATQTEALAMGLDVVATWIDALRADGLPVPPSTPYRHRPRSGKAAEG